jgi:hypothetical protein
MKRLLIFFVVLFFANDWALAQDLSGFFEFGSGQANGGFYTLDGSWTYATSSLAISGDYIYTTSTTATITVNFEGQRFWLFALTGSSANDYIEWAFYSNDVYITGGEFNIDTPSSFYILDVPFPFGYDNTKLVFFRAQHVSGYIRIDGFLVEPKTAADSYPTPYPTPTEITLYPTPTEFQMTPDGATLYATVTADGIEQVVAFRYQVDAGQVMIVILLAAMFFVLLVILITSMRKKAPEP